MPPTVAKSVHPTLSKRVLAKRIGLGAEGYLMCRQLVIFLLGVVLGFNVGCASLAAQEKKPAKKTAKYLAAIKEPPTYVRNENYDKKWFQTVKTGFDKTRDYLGNYGPVQVYIVGQEGEELSDPACVDHNAVADFNAPFAGQSQ